jgi:uncharacterized protein YegL
MNPTLTEIAFVLDRSGSMENIAHAAISGFNHFLREQQEAPGEARLTLVLFDDEYLVPVDNVPVRNVAPLNSDTYVPRNTTALLDAVGETIDRLGRRLAATAEPERPAKVIVAILTDGLENASTRFTWHDVSSRIKHQTEVYKWEFLFLGANQDAIATAANLNISSLNAATFAADSVGASASQRALSKKAAVLRARPRNAPLTSACIHIASTPLNDLVAEEDRKERGS